MGTRLMRVYLENALKQCVCVCVCVFVCVCKSGMKYRKFSDVFEELIVLLCN